MQTEVRLKKKGPIVVKGKFKIIGIDGKQIIVDTDTVRLCSCGQSKNMPFCDETHDK